MSTTHAPSDHLHTNAEDPTGTTTTRNELTSHFHGRVNDIAGVIRTTIGENDALRLKSTRTHPPTSGPRTSGFSGDSVPDFGTQTDSERLAAWQAFLPAVLDAHLVEPMPTAQVRAGRHYTAPYIRRGYSRGLALAQQDARQAGLVGPEDLEDQSPTDVITREPHQDALAREFLGTYDDLEMRAADIRTDTVRTLSEELVAGVAAYALANTLTTRVRKRAEHYLSVIATSRVVDSVNEAVLRHGRELGAEGVGVALETDGGEDVEGSDGEVGWLTSLDNRVCDRCKRLAADGPYRIEDVLRGSAPKPGRDSHPGCRCRYFLIG